MTCKCSPDVLVCLRHYSNLCSCHAENYTLRYRYTLDELPVMLKSLKLKAESFDHWVSRVKDALDPKTPKTLTLQELKALLNEADGKKFPKCELLQTLTDAVEDAEKCARVIQQLDLNKMRTRTRNSSDTKYKLTLKELILFHEELDSLVCVLDEAKSIRELLDETKKFEATSKTLLEMKLSECAVTELESCISQGNNLCIELPNLRNIKVRLRQSIWLNDVLSYKKKTEVLGLESITNIIKTGTQLPPNPEIEKELSDLQMLLNKSQEWEDKVKAILKDKGSDVLIEVDRLLKEAGQINSYLPSEEFLFESMDRARDWLRQLEEMNSAECYPYFKDMEELIHKGHQLALHLVEVSKLESYLETANSWKEKTSRAFLRKNSSCTLMEALSPRGQLSNAVKSRKKNQDDDSVIFGLTSDMDPATVVALFKEAEQKEMKLIKTTRTANMEKSLDPKDGATFCVCQRGLFGLMMQCELCKDWFHSNCTPLPKVASSKYKGNFTSVALHLGFKDCKFLCPNCYRTKRPRLDAILLLLMSLQKLFVRVPEGEALQSLTERAMNWQDRARQLMQNSDLEAAKNKLSSLSQKYSEAAARQRTEKIISNELKRAFKNPELHQRVQEIAPYSGLVGQQQEESNGKVDESPLNDSSDDSKECNSSTDDRTGEHAYSLHFPKFDNNEYRLHISPEIRRQMEELLLEGDLLEVYLDETFQLWKLLQASRDVEKEAILIDFDVSGLFKSVIFNTL